MRFHEILFFTRLQIPFQLNKRTRQFDESMPCFIKLGNHLFSLLSIGIIPIAHRAKYRLDFLSGDRHFYHLAIEKIPIARPKVRKDVARFSTYDLPY